MNRILVLMGSMLVLLAPIVSAAQQEDSHWKGEAVVVGAKLAGPVILDCKYVNGADYEIIDSKALVQPGFQKDWFYVFLVKDNSGDRYMAFATYRDAVPFSRMYKGKCLHKINSCGTKFLVEGVYRDEDYPAKQIADMKKNTRELMRIANSGSNSLFKKKHDGVNPVKDSYVVLYKLRE